MNVFVPISLLSLALFYTLAQGLAVVALASVLEKQKKFSVSMNAVIIVDIILCAAAAVCGAFL